MRYDFHLLFILIAVGLLSRKFNWKGWFCISLLIITWMTLNMWKGLNS